MSAGERNVGRNSETGGARKEMEVGGEDGRGRISRGKVEIHGWE